MKRRFLALGMYALFWLAFFAFARLYFIIAQFNEAANYNSGTLIATFWHGMKLDVSATGYFMIFPILLAVPGIYFNGKWYRVFLKYYSWLLIILSSVVVVSDANLYTYWGFRMDHTPLLYLKTPKDAFASVTTFRMILHLFLMIILAWIFIFTYNKLIDKLFTDFKRIKFWYIWIFVFLILLGSLLIPIRGGFGIAPINAGTVYFSESMFPNHVSINVIWNVGHSAFTGKSTKNPYIFTDPVEAEKQFKALNFYVEKPEKLLKPGRPNILLIVLESFGSHLIEPLGGDKGVTPCFNKNVKEGILFTHFYATGGRTDKAIPAIFSGYPSQPTTSIIKDPKKTQSLPNLVKIFNDSGYYTSFWYGGDINFANFNSYVISSGFKRIITKNNFDPADYNSKWGTHDHVLFRAFQDSMKHVREPFFSVVLTLSSHEPFEVPVKPVFTGNDDHTKFRNSVFYTDKVVGAFLDSAKNLSWWDHTLVILVADHCRRYSIEIPVYSPEIFKIPMLWMGGALNKKGVIIDKFGSQTDIPPTLADQLNLHGVFPFGKDLISKDSKSYAFYTFNEGFALITDSSTIIYDCKLKDTVVREGNGQDYLENSGKSYLQFLFADYLKR